MDAGTETRVGAAAPALPRPQVRERLAAVRPGSVPGWLGLAAGAALAVVLIGSLVGQHWYASSDWAIEVLRIRDTGGAHTPLVGAFSRLGFAHPGPLLFWVLAPFQWAFGDTGVLAGTAVVNVAALVGASWAARRIGGNRLLVLLWIASAALVHTLGLAFLLDPWNPYAPLLPYLAYLLFAWAASEGDLPMLPLAVLAGTFAVQAHVGYAPVVAGPAVVLAILGPGRRWGAAWSARRRGDVDEPEPAAASDEPAVPAATAAPGWRRWATWGWGSLALAVALWLPPLIQQLTGSPGNLSEILDGLTNPVGKQISWEYAVGVFGQQVGPPQAWLHDQGVNGLGLLGTSGATGAVLLILASVALAVVAWRRGCVRPARLLVLAVTGVGFGLFATSRVTGILVAYIAEWWAALVLLLDVAIAWCLVELALPYVERARRPVLAIATAAAVTLSVVVLAAGVPTPLPEPNFSAAVRQISGPTAAALHKDRHYFLDPIDRFDLGAVSMGLLAELEHRGYHVYLKPSFATTIGGWRTRSAKRSDATIQVIAGRELRMGWHANPRGKVIVDYDPLKPSERRREVDLQDRVKQQLGQFAPQGQLIVTSPAVFEHYLGLGAHRSTLEELRKLQLPGDGYRVLLLEPATPL